MIRITSITNVPMPAPDQIWSCTPGANHFDTDMPPAVATRFRKLQTAGVVTVEVIDGAHITAWQPPALT